MSGVRERQKLAFMAGFSVREVALQFGISEEGVRQSLRCLGVPVREIVKKRTRSRNEAIDRMTMEYWRTIVKFRLRAAGLRKCVRCHEYDYMGRRRDHAECLAAAVRESRERKKGKDDRHTTAGCP